MGSRLPLTLSTPPADILRRYPRLVAHLICASLGYATPTLAAIILRDAKLRRPNHCEWIASCYGGDALQPVRHAIQGRHRHHGYMADYAQAKSLVDHVNRDGEEPFFASWF